MGYLVRSMGAQAGEPHSSDFTSLYAAAALALTRKCTSFMPLQL